MSERVDISKAREDYLVPLSQTLATNSEQTTTENGSGQVSPERVNRFNKGDVLTLPDGISIRVLGKDLMTGQYAVYEARPGEDREEALMMSEEELASLADELSASEPTSASPKPETAPKKAPESSVENTDEPSVETAPIDFASIQPGDVVISNKATAAGVNRLTVSATRLNEQTGKREFTLSDINTKDGGETAHVWVTEDNIQELVKSSNEGDPSGEAEGSAASNEPAPPESSVAEGESLEQSQEAGRVAAEEVARLENVWREAVRRYGAQGDRSDAASAEARAAYKAFQEARAAHEADFLNEAGLAEAAEEVTTNEASAEGRAEAEVDPNAPLSPEEQAEFDAIANRAGSAEQATAEQAQQQAERLRHIETETARLTAEVDSIHGPILRAAMAEYAQLKAVDESKGGGFLGYGRKKREVALRKIEERLTLAKLAYEQEVIRRKREAGLYEGDEAAIKTKSEEELFEAIRGLDRESREATNAELKRRMENRNILQKASARIGQFFMKGGKVSQALKGMGTGFVPTFLIGATGVGIPVTAVAGAVIGAGLREAVFRANLDSIRAENIDAAGNGVEALSAEGFAAWKQRMETGQIQSDTHKAETLASDIFNASRERGRKQVDRARKAGRWVMTGYAAGAAAGTLLGSAYDGVGATDGAGVGSEGTPPGADGGAGGGGGAELNLSADIRKGAGGKEQIMELLQNNGVDTSKITESEILSKWKEVTTGTKDVFTANGSAADLYKMKDGYMGINAPNASNTWSKEVGTSIYEWGKNLAASR